MKIFFLIASLFLISFISAEITLVKKNARAIVQEELSLEFLYAGSCREFIDRDLPTAYVSQHRGCLPIQFNVTGNPDYNDLNAHLFCTRVGKHRSVIHFVEIYNGTSDDTLFPTFVVSFVPSAPIRVLTPKTSLARRPNCEITHDYCDATYAVVSSCRTNQVRIKEHHVVNHDRIYITGGQAVSHDCKTTNAECCEYIAPDLLGGICPLQASRDRLNFPSNYNYGRPSQGKPSQQQQQERPAQQEQEQEYKRPSQGRPQNNEQDDD